MTIQYIEFMVEERSMAAALDVLVPRLTDVPFTVREFQGKLDLVGKVESRFRGYQSWLAQSGGAVVVLVDRDEDECLELKRKVIDKATATQMMLASTIKPAAPGSVLVRVVVEELEAWFFGDVAAIVAAYPGVPTSLAERAGFRDPDAIAGGTWEALERVLQDAGHHKGGLAKVRAAREIAAHMDVNHNRSRSFQVFRDGIRHLVQEWPHAQA